MSGGHSLQNSFGPEATPYQALNHQPAEYDSRGLDGKIVVNTGEPPELVLPKEPKWEAPPRRTILGVRVAVFWAILVALILITGTAIGVGVGVTVGRKNNAPSPPASTSPIETTSKRPDNTSTRAPAASTTTSSSAVPVATSGTHGLAANSCTFSTPRTFYGSDGSTFTQYCFTDWPNGADAADGSGTITDLDRTIVYTFENCMEACLKYNKQLQKSDTKCAAVTYNSNLTSIVEEGKQGGNCFLKSAKGQNRQGSAESACAALVF